MDPYDIYQHLMDYWTGTMQDDVYMLVSDGWKNAARPRHILDDKDKNRQAKQVSKEKPDFTIGKLKFKAELIPPALMIARYFSGEQAAIEKLEAEATSIEQKVEELREEHGGDEGLLVEAMDDGKLSKGTVAARLKSIAGDKDATDERKLLDECLALMEAGSTLGRRVKDAQKALEEQVAARYLKLTEDEIKTLVVDDKWLTAIAAAVEGELDRVSQTLTGRIKQLAERYGTPLPTLVKEVDPLAARVDGHLKRMGFSA